jgi:hypothetical protein
MDHILTVSKCPPNGGLVGMKFQPGKTYDLADIILSFAVHSGSGAGSVSACAGGA